MRRLAAVLALLTLGAIPASATWTFETVDTGGVGAHSCIRIGPQDVIHIADFAGGVGHLKYSFFDGTSWTSETVDPQYLSGHLPSLDLDSGGRPHIAYYFYSGRAIRYASQADTGWTIGQFESDPNYEWDFSMKLDASDHPHVSYQDDSYGAQDLAYAVYDGTAWTTALIDTPGHCGRGSSITLDASGHPWISYYDETNIRLKVAHYDGTRWILETLDNVELIGFNFRTAIAVDRLDRIHVVYSAYHYDGANWRGRLKYALHDASGWQISTIEEGAPTRDFRVPAIAIDAANRPEVAYLIYFNTEPTGPYLKYARFNGSFWLIQVVKTDGLADSDYSCSIALDSHGRPHLSFCYNQTVLMHAVGDAPADVATGGGATAALALSPPWPNPSRGAARLRFFLPAPGEADLGLYDTGGRRVGALAHGILDAGAHTVDVPGTLPGGVYICRLASGGATAATKLVIR